MHLAGTSILWRSNSKGSSGWRLYLPALPHTQGSREVGGGLWSGASPLGHPESTGRQHCPLSQARGQASAALTLFPGTFTAALR